MINGLGSYVAQLRAQRGLSLRKVEDLTGIPNAYLSQLETGQKKYLPSPTLLFKLSACLGVSTKDLLAKAGYLEQPTIEESLENKVDKAFRHAATDPQFRYGAVLKNKYDFNIKRFVVELYEKATGRNILGPAFTDEVAPSGAGQMQFGNSSTEADHSSRKISKRGAKKIRVDSQTAPEPLSIRSVRKEGL